MLHLSDNNHFSGDAHLYKTKKDFHSALLRRTKCSDKQSSFEITKTCALKLKKSGAGRNQTVISR